MSKFNPFSSFNSTISFRFVDHDMLMRYHWGLGIGHTYSHDSPTNSVWFCTPQCSQLPHHVKQDYIDERNGGESIADASIQTESDSEPEFELEGCDSGSGSESE